MSADFEPVVYNNPQSGLNIQWAEEQKRDPNASGYIFTTIGEDMKKIADENIAWLKKDLLDKIPVLLANYEDARASIDVGVGVLKNCPPGWSEGGIAGASLTCNEPIDTSQGYYNYTGGCVGCWDYDKWWHTGCKWDCHRTWIASWTGGRIIGKMNAENDGGNLLSCPDSHPDRIDGLCYRRCPASHPLHLNGMPYKCVKTQDTTQLIKDDFAFNTYKYLDVVDAIQCVQAQANEDWGKVQQHCGKDWGAKFKGIGQEIFVNLMGVVSMGVYDILDLVLQEATKDLPEELGGKKGFYSMILGEEPYSEFDKKHAEGIVDSMLNLKFISKQKACKNAIDQKSVENYVKYCELQAPETDEQGALVKDAQGNLKYLSILPRLPADDLKPEDIKDVSSMIPDEEWLLKQIPVVPVLDESKIPEFPPELFAEIPQHLLPGAPPLKPTQALNTGIKNPEPYNILDNPAHILLGGLILSAIFF